MHGRRSGARIYWQSVPSPARAHHTCFRKAPNVQILQVVLQVILGITSLLLTLLILLHKGRGGGLSDMFGGGVTSSLGSSGVAERNLNRITIILGVVWIACIIVLGLITKFSA